jgi:hypothetical protein
VGKGAKRRAHLPSPNSLREGGLASLSPPYIPATPYGLKSPEPVHGRIAWCDWPDEIIFERLADFRSEKIEEFCKRYDPAFVHQTSS